MGLLTDFRPGETKSFKTTIHVDAVAQNITADTVTFRLKEKVDDTDANAKITKVADVATEGAGGTAIVALAPADSASLIPGKYHWDIVWEPAAGGEYVVNTGVVYLLRRVSDP